MEEGSVISFTHSPKVKQMESGGKKSLDSSIWEDPVSSPTSNQSCIPDHYQSRDTVGTCLIVFALPLLIPGITLTAVAFEDETGFSKYSALHVLGMVMLVLAGLFILVGVALIARIGYKVSPECNDGHSPTESTHDSSTRPSPTILDSRSSIVHKSSKDLKSTSSITAAMPPIIPSIIHPKDDPTDNPRVINTTAPSSVPIPPSQIPLNFMIETGQGHNPDHLNTTPKASTVGTLPLIHNMNVDLSNRLSGYSGQGYSRNGLDGYVSSSYDEYSDELDSDDNSSGSYVITGENGAFQYSDEEDHPRQNSTSRKNNEISNQAPNKTSTTPRSGLTLNFPPSRNFFFEENFPTTVQNVPDCSKMKRITKVTPFVQQNNLRPTEQTEEATSSHLTPTPNCSENETETRRNNNNHILRETPTSKLNTMINSTPTRVVPSPLSSPRQRLEAISNVSALTSSMQSKINEDLQLDNIGGEMSESNGSVFTSGEEADPVLAEDAKDTKRLSADDVICRQQKFVPSPKRTFSFDVTTDDEIITQTTGITDAAGSLGGSNSQMNKEVTSSPKLVSILRSTSAYNSPNQQKARITSEDDSSADTSTPLSSAPHSGNAISSAIISPSTTIFNVMNIDFNDNREIKDTVGKSREPNVPPSCNQERHMSCST